MSFIKNIFINYLNIKKKYIFLLFISNFLKIIIKNLGLLILFFLINKIIIQSLYNI